MKVAWWWGEDEEDSEDSLEVCIIKWTRVCVWGGGGGGGGSPTLKPAHIWK